MRPGLTCLWAVAGRDALDFETWMKMDMQYIDTWSLALDWKIICAPFRACSPAEEPARICT
jgi:lipopolysaccharide/colanic/teichoic acid biosynthesis glycosyltransferase